MSLTERLETRRSRRRAEALAGARSVQGYVRAHMTEILGSKSDLRWEDIAAAIAEEGITWRSGGRVTGKDVRSMVCRLRQSEALKGGGAAPAGEAIHPRIGAVQRLAQGGTTLDRTPPEGPQCANPTVDALAPATRGTEDPMGGCPPARKVGPGEPEGGAACPPNAQVGERPEPRDSTRPGIDADGYGFGVLPPADEDLLAQGGEAPPPPARPKPATKATASRPTPPPEGHPQPPKKGYDAEKILAEMRRSKAERS